VKLESFPIFFGFECFLASSVNYHVELSGSSARTPLWEKQGAPITGAVRSLNIEYVLVLKHVLTTFDAGDAGLYLGSFIYD
jgi:hypothetical protein